jgi:hypothetical protein
MTHEDNFPPTSPKTSAERWMMHCAISVSSFESPLHKARP